MANSTLSRTQVAGNRTTFTFSAWVKRSKLGSYQMILSTGTDGTYRTQLAWHEDDIIQFYNNDNNVNMELKTNRKFFDTNAWYHIVLRFDTTQGTAADRIRLYVNGEQETSFSTATYPPQGNDSTMFNKNGNTVKIGSTAYASSNFFEGYMSHAVFVDGASLAPTSFGSTDSTSGIWKFKSPSGLTFGNNGYHLKFENSGNMGLDSSGESHNFTAAGDLTQALDTPSNVHATLNPLNPADNKTISKGGNRIVGSNASNYSMSITSTLAANTGKWYWEVKYTSANSNTNACVGAVKTENYEYNQNITSGTGGYVNMRFDGYSFINNNSADLGLSGVPQAGDIIMAAMDLDNGKMWLGTNGTWYTTGGGVGNPATGAYPTFTTSDLTDGTWTPVIRYLAGTFDCNFGNGVFSGTPITSAGSNGNGSLFEYDVPSGYYALNTKNINTYG